MALQKADLRGSFFDENREVRAGRVRWSGLGGLDGLRVLVVLKKQSRRRSIRNKKRLGTSASLLVTSALLVVTMFASRTSALLLVTILDNSNYKGSSFV